MLFFSLFHSPSFLIYARFGRQLCNIARGAIEWMCWKAAHLMTKSAERGETDRHNIFIKCITRLWIFIFYRKYLWIFDGRIELKKIADSFSIGMLLFLSLVNCQLCVAWRAIYLCNVFMRFSQSDVSFDWILMDKTCIENKPIM